MKKGIIFIMMLTVIFLSPMPVLAVDYSIDKMQIDAYLQKDGNVQVKEQQTYTFDGKFNGITRSLIPKEETNITDVKANENGKNLQVKQDDNEYKVYRKGKDDQVTFDLSYTIEDGVTLYSDAGEFYWPFFDDSNESDYEQFDVFVHPPQATDDGMALGYDEAENTADIENDGVAHFAMGKVPAETKGDVRVAYDADLFPETALTKEKNIKPDLLEEKQEMAEARATHEKRQQMWSSLAPYLVGGFTIYFLLICLYAWRKKRLRDMEIDRQFTAPAFIPDNKMSMPATIAFMGDNVLGAEGLTAALLDLVRKDYVKREKEHTFTVNHRHVDFEHEKLLIHWLFDTIGQDGVFQLNDLKQYTDNKKNHEKYEHDFDEWRQAVREEMNSHQLYKKKTKMRGWIGFSGVLLIPQIILFAVYNVYGWMVASIVLVVALGTFALLYRPETEKGAKWTAEWKSFQESYPEATAKQWKELTTDDQQRAFIYGIGLDKKQIKQKNEQLLEADPDIRNSHSDIAYFVIIASIANQQFTDANSAAVASTSGGAPGGGTGIGGGGGGSGAF